MGGWPKHGGGWLWVYGVGAVDLVQTKREEKSPERREEEREK